MSSVSTLSYTVPLQKGNKSCSKSLTVDDFRGISISPVLSKVFEHCILSRFGTYFTSDNQFGFKKSTGCSHAIYCARSVISHYVAGGSTVNLCALDISKAFDRMDHHGLYIKLMHRCIPENLLRVFENWFFKCYSCVRWFEADSVMYKVEIGVRQGGVLSPQFFAIYIDDIVNLVNKQGIGCFMHHVCASIILYADDILLMSPSVTGLQKLLSVVESELNALGMFLNSSKSVCMRIGPQCQTVCTNLLALNGHQLCWVKELRYLGVYFVSSCKFKCSLDEAKKSFFRSFNAVYGRVGRFASEEVILSLIKSKCIPCLLYGIETIPISSTDSRSVVHTVRRLLFKIFKTFSVEIIEDCEFCFGFARADELIKRRKSRFLCKFIASENYLCSLFAEFAQSDFDNL